MSTFLARLGISPDAVEYIRAAPIETNFVIEEHNALVRMSAPVAVELFDSAQIDFGVEYRRTTLKQTESARNELFILGERRYRDSDAGLRVFRLHCRPRHS